MKNRISILAGALAFGALLFQPLHAAESAKPASVVSLMDFRNQLNLLQGDIAGIVGSLNLVKSCATKQDELTKAVADLNSRFDRLQNRVETVRSNAVILKATVKAHYEAWAKELTSMQSASLREKAQDRLTRSEKEFEKISAQAAEAKEELLPFVSDIKDCVIYLNADTSDEAVNTLSNTIWKLGNRSRSVSGSITDVIEQIDATVKSLPQR
jgi:outer membrane murein-binding lipoprotein Lpp